MERTIAALEALLKQLSARKKVYLLLDNPIGPEFDPKRLLQGGSRMGQMSAAHTTPTTPWPPEQKELNQRLREVAQRSGAIVIDPVSRCARTTSAFAPPPTAHRSTRIPTICVRPTRASSATRSIVR